MSHLDNAASRGESPELRLATGTAPHTRPASSNQSPSTEHPPISATSARRGRVHWDGNTASIARGGILHTSAPSSGIEATSAPAQQTASAFAAAQAASRSAQRRVHAGQGGATVTLRARNQPPTPGSVNRAFHPGPLQLSSRLAEMSADAAAAPNAPGSAPPVAESAGEDPMQPNNVAAAQYFNAQPEISAPSNHLGAPASANVPALSLTGAKGLDERGLDSRAFLELQRELQRHESNVPEVVEPSSARLAPVSEDGGRAAFSRRHAARRADTPDYDISASMSGASTPGVEWASGTSDTGSYDPAADSDLDHIDVIPGETDGMPSRPRRRKTQQQKREDEQEEQPKGWARLRAILRKPAEDEEGDEKGLPTTRADVGNDEAGGPTNRKSVPVTTSTGTHSGPRHRPTRFEREAARLVKAHRLMTGQSVESDGMPGGAAAAGLGRMPTMSRKHLDSEASTPDALDTAANLDARPVAAGGVLGNLLRLYEQQQREAARKQKELAESRATSPLSTPPVSGVRGGAGAPANLSDLVAAELARETAATASSIGPVPADARSKARRRSYWSAENTGGANSPGPAALAGAFVAEGTAKIAGATKKVAQVAARESGIDDAVDDRPKAARSNAGTIGGLVAVTGNLIGAVSPWHAQLGPNPKRPGYTLDRYLLPEMNEKTLRKTAEIVADAAPRPRRSAPGTPHLPGIGTSVSSSPHPNDSSETAAASPQDGAASPHKTTSRPASVLLGPARRNTDATVGGNAHRKGSSLSQFSSHLYGKHGWRSNVNTPDVYTADSGGDYFGHADPEMDDKLQKLEWQRKLKKRAKDKRKKEEIFITMHVAAILQRQEFLLKLARALMMFGAPTHRIETQIQQTARVLEINARCIYLPNLMLLAFGDDATHTSETKFIKQAGGLDLTKLTDMHSIYWNVIHDKIGVEEASSQLDELMRRKPVIGMWPMVFIGGFCSSFICVGSMGFNGSFIDALVAFPLGMFLVYCQSVITTELFSNVFEIVFAAINSFVASALASTQYFCYAAVVSGSIVLILPGFIVLSGSLELQSKNLIAGSVRLVYAIIYSLFLGFGISIGSSFWLLFSGSGDSTIQYLNCTDPAVHPPNVWWRETVPLAWGFLTVPGYATALSMRNQVKVNRKEFPVMVLIACAGWAVNHFSSTAGALTGRQDITSALGSLCVGVLANIYGRIFDGRAFVVSVPGILYQLPSGLSNGGLLNFARSGTGSSATSNFNSGFDVAQSLVEVAIGLTVGLFAATMLAYVFGGRKIRGGGLFSF